MTLAAAAAPSETIQMVTLVIAVLGVTLAALSLGWQAALYRLTGGRVKLELRVGAMHRSAAGMVHQAVDGLTSDWAARLAQQGYTRPVLVVHVRNVGRMPVTVNQWSLVETAKGTAFRPIGDSIGPTLPHRLEAGTSETWAVGVAPIIDMVAAATEAFGLTPGAVPVCGQVELGDGRSYRTRESLTM